MAKFASGSEEWKEEKRAKIRTINPRIRPSLSPTRTPRDVDASDFFSLSKDDFFQGTSMAKKMATFVKSKSDFGVSAPLAPQRHSRSKTAHNRWKVMMFDSVESKNSTSRRGYSHSPTRSSRHKRDSMDSPVVKTPLSVSDRCRLSKSSHGSSNIAFDHDEHDSSSRRRARTTAGGKPLSRSRRRLKIRSIDRSSKGTPSPDRCPNTRGVGRHVSNESASIPLAPIQPLKEGESDRNMNTRVGPKKLGDSPPTMPTRKRAPRQSRSPGRASSRRRRQSGSKRDSITAAHKPSRSKSLDKHSSRDGLQSSGHRRRALSSLTSNTAATVRSEHRSTFNESKQLERVEETFGSPKHVGELEDIFTTELPRPAANTGVIYEAERSRSRNLGSNGRYLIDPSETSKTLLDLLSSHHNSSKLSFQPVP